MPRPTPPYAFLLLVVFLWLGLIVAAPWLQSRNVGAASLIYYFFSHICHQIPDRSFSWNGSPLAVCHRCWGLFLGFWMGLLVIPWVPALGRRLLERPRLLLAFLVPLGLDVLTANTWASRLTTGLLAGFPAALFMWIAVEQLGTNNHWTGRRL